MDGNKDGERLAIQGQERRAHPRYSVDEECLLLLVNHGMPVKARMVELSMEGCRVRTAEPFPAKAGRTVEVSFKVKGFAFRFCGVVRWSDGHQIAGIHFENMIPRRKVELAEVIDEMAAVLAARKQTLDQVVVKPNTPSPSPPQPTVIAAEPARPVKPAEPSLAQKTAAAPAADIRAPEASNPPKMETSIAGKMGPAAPHSAKPRDRRTQSRHEVDTTATILLVKVASALRGRIVDLSLGGCRIHTDKKFPVGIYTRVEVEFHLQGLPFRLGGVIQAIHNRNTVGIRLLDLSERKRQQVLELIDELDEMRAETGHDEESPRHDRGLAESR